MLELLKSACEIAIKETDTRHKQRQPAFFYDNLQEATGLNFVVMK